MNILFLTRLFYPHIGGVEKHTLKLAQQLTQHSLNITILTTQYESSLSLEDNYQNLKIIRIPKSDSISKFKTWKWIWQNQQLFQSQDIIHAHDVTYWYLPLTFKLKKPFFTTFHGWEGTYPPTFKAKIWRKISENVSHKNICVGDYISKWYGTKSNLVTYGATDQTPLNPGSPDRILFLGRLSPDNDLSIVIPALKKIKQQLPKLKVSFLGDGEVAWECEQVGKVLGFQEDITDHLSQAGVVITSSYLSMAEAMAAGRQVYSTYSNPLKKDYLTLHPMAKNISISYTSDQLATDFLKNYHQPQLQTKSIQKTQNWALKQTWKKLAIQYLDFWTQDNPKLAQL